MRLIVALVFAFGVMTGSAMADPMAAFYGNTVVVTHPEAGERSVFIDADGTYNQIMADGTEMGGAWTLEEETACFTSEDSPPYCVPAEERSIGESWEITNPDGVTETATLVEGR